MISNPSVYRELLEIQKNFMGRPTDEEEARFREVWGRASTQQRLYAVVAASEEDPKKIRLVTGFDVADTASWQDDDNYVELTRMLSDPVYSLLASELFLKEVEEMRVTITDILKWMRINYSN